MAKGFRLLLQALLAWFTLAACAWADEPHALKGVALVVGQSKYAHVTALANPSHDAEAMRSLLEQLGFSVTLVTDRSARQLKRDLDNFAADAADAQADVALVYYSGHGIEAGGENYLVAADMDPAAAADGLVPVNDLLATLKTTVPVSIILLDACRSNPFPPGFALARDGGQTPVSASGLGVPRGVSDAGGEAGGGLGMVIGFAAAPGTAALDGEAGGNSPYTAALLRHLSALDGVEFGQVLRMVTEEVYLKTKGRQRPWVNETLTKFLYFGGAAQTTDPVARRIDHERRPLLLMIADLPLAQRAQVEAAAAREDVPLDTLYGVLRAFGESDMPKDAATLERLLADQAQQLKRFKDERTALSADDPELKRLATAADQALAEGALVAAREFLAEAKTRVDATQTVIADTEARIRAKRLANGAIYARSGEAAALAFDYQGAAADYAKAYDWIKDTGDDSAWTYLWSEASWLSAFGQETGNQAALSQAVAVLQQSLSLAPRATRALDWATAQNDIGSTLRIIGENTGDADTLKQAIAAFTAALEVRRPETDADAFAATQMNLGNAYAALGRISGENPYFADALKAYQAALPLVTRDAAPYDWAKLQANMGAALTLMADNDSRNDLYDQAIAAFRAALSVYDKTETPSAWASAQGNLGSALSSLGEREEGVASLEQAVNAFNLALGVFDRNTQPVSWARIMNNLGNALRLIGMRHSGTAELEQAAAVLDASRSARHRDAAPMAWALTTANIGNVLGEIGLRTSDAGTLARSISEYDAALDIFTPERSPPQWAMVAWAETRILLGLGQLTKDRAVLKKGLVLCQAILDFDRENGRDTSEVKSRLKAFKTALTQPG